MNKCESCGARIDLKEDSCPYCGTAYIKEQPRVVNQISEEEIKQRVQEAEQKRYLRNLLPGIIMFFIFPVVGFFVLFFLAIKENKRRNKN